MKVSDILCKFSYKFLIRKSLIATHCMTSDKYGFTALQLPVILDFM